MRLAIALVIAACGGAATKPSPPPIRIAPAPAHHTPPAAPAVANAAVLAAEDATTTPPVVLLIEASGQRSLAAAPSWADLAAGKYSTGPKPANPQAAWMHLKEGLVLQHDPKTIVDGFVDSVPVRPVVDGSQDDPPPPEEDDETGTAMALDEGKLAKREARRKSARAGAMFEQTTADDPWPRRESKIVGEIGAPLDPQPAVIVAVPTAKAADVIAAITQTEAMIGVAHQGTIRRLRLQFVRARDAIYTDPPAAWIEVHVTAHNVELEAAPDVPIPVQLDDLASGLAIAVKRRKRVAEGLVDVLVAPDVTAQRFVDVLVALDVAGVKAIGIGLAPKPGSQAAKTRGHRIPLISLGQPNSQGDLDKKLIRDAIVKQRDAIFACYTQALVKKPELEGTVNALFFITPLGKVSHVSAHGIDVDVASCVAATIKKIQFTKPKGGGGVQVSYPFSFRQ